MTQLDRTLAALADPTRLRVVDLLRERPRPAGDLARRIRVSPPALSRHLRVLRHGGLIEEKRDLKDARLRIYQLKRRPFRDLQSWLTNVESIWTAQLDAFKAHAEKPRAGAKSRSKRVLE